MIAGVGPTVCVRLALLTSLALLAACGGRNVLPPQRTPGAEEKATRPEAPSDPAVAAAAAEAAGRPRTARLLWSEAADHEPASPAPHRALARLAPDAEHALPHLLWLAGRPDATPHDHADLVAKLIEAGRLRDAVQAAEIARTHWPTDPLIVGAAARSLIRAGATEAGLALRARLYTGTEADSAAQRVGIARALLSAGLEDRAEAEFTSALQAVTTSPVIWIAFAESNLERRHRERAVGLLHEASLRFPESAAVAAALARALEASGEADAALSAWDEAIARAPDEPDFADGRARTLLAAGRADEAVAAWEKAVAAFPAAESARMHLALALRVREQPGDVVRVLRPWAALRPEDARVQMALGEAELALGLPEAMETLRRASAAGAEPRLVQPMLARAVAEHGSAEAAREHFARAVNSDPANGALRFAFAQFCVRIGDLACAESELTRRLARDPMDAQARELLESVLSGAPDAALRLAMTEDWPAARGDPELSGLAARARPAVGGLVATVLRDEREVRVDGGLVTRVVHRRSVLIQTAEGGERYREVVVSFNVHRPAVVRRARILTPEGEERALSPNAMPVRDPNDGGPLQGDAREQVLRFEGLEPGAIIDYEVEVPQPHPDALGAWWDRYVMSNVDPTVRARYRLDAPRGVSFRAEAPGMGAPHTTQAEGRQQWLWEREDLPATNLEADSAAPAASVSVASVSDWAGVSQWFHNLFEPQAVGTPGIHQAARRATAGLRTRRERVAALYAFVETRTAYLGDELGIGAFRPRPAERTLETQSGDCKDVTALLVALLRAVGIEAWPALVRPDGPGIFGESHPTPAQFTHVLVFVPDPAGDFWLDATARLGTVDAVPAVLRGRTALVVDDRRGRVIRIPDGEPRRSRLDEWVNLTLTPTGGGTLTKRVVTTGDVAAEVRQRLLGLPDAERTTMLRAPGLFLGGAHRPDVVAWSGLADAAGPLSLSGELSSRDLVGLRTDGALTVRLELDALVAPVLSGASAAQLTGRTVVRRLRLEPPGGLNAFTWPPLRLRHRAPGVELQVDERREAGATTVTVSLAFDGPPRDEKARARWLQAMEAVKRTLDRDLVMRPGPGFDAVAFFGALAAERPGDARLVLLQARAQLARGHLADAQRTLRAAVSTHGDSAELVRLWMDILGVSGAPVPWPEVEAAVTRHTTDAAVQTALGDLAGRGGDSGRAERAYRAALATAPENGRALNNLAWLLRDVSDRRSEALALAHRAVAAAPESDAAWDTLAELRFLSGDVRGALEAIEEAHRRGPERAGLYDERRARYQKALKPESGAKDPPR